MIQSIKDKTILTVFGLMILLLTGGQGALLSPAVACIESDGNMHVEPLCVADVHGAAGYDQTDPCRECVDVPLWPDKPEQDLALSAKVQPPILADLPVSVSAALLLERPRPTPLAYYFPRITTQNQTCIESIRLLI